VWIGKKVKEMKKTNRANIKVTLIVATSKDGYISPADGVTLPSTKWTMSRRPPIFYGKNPRNKRDDYGSSHL
jgi:hypothetical protein